MVIKVQVGDVSIEVPGKGSLPWAIASVQALEKGTPLLIDMPQATAPINRQLESKPQPAPEPKAVKPEPTKEAPKELKPTKKTKKEKSPKAYPSREEQQRTARLLINSGQSFYFQKLGPFSNDAQRQWLMKWLRSEFQIDIIPKDPLKKVNLYNPYCVVPYTFERAGVKKYAPMPWEFENEAVQGAGLKPVKSPAGDVPSDLPASDTFQVA